MKSWNYMNLHLLWNYESAYLAIYELNNVNYLTLDNETWNNFQNLRVRLEKVFQRYNRQFIKDEMFHVLGTYEWTWLAFGTGIDLAVEEICRAGG